MTMNSSCKLAMAIISALGMTAVSGLDASAHAQSNGADHASNQALADLERIAQSSRQDPAAQRAYGNALFRAGLYGPAEQRLRRAADLSGRSPEAYYRAAEPAFARGDYRAAQSACRFVERARGEDGGRQGGWARLCRARTFLVWNRASRAFDEIEPVVEREGVPTPLWYEALIAQGDAHRLRGDQASAESDYRAAIQLESAWPLAHLSLGRLLAPSDADRARPSLQTAYDRSQRSPESALALARVSSTDARRRLLREALRERTGWADALVLLGQTELGAGQTEAARNAFLEATLADPQRIEAQIGLARAETQSGNFAAAAEAIARALTLVPNSADAFMAQGELHAAQGEHEPAFAAYERASNLRSSDPAALLAAASLALRLNRDVLSAGYLDRLMGRHPNLGAALMLYGDVMMARSNGERAREYYGRALREGTGTFDRARAERAVSGQ